MGIPLISGQTPAPGATDIGLRPQIDFTVSQNGTNLDPTTTQVWINGTLAYDAGAGGFQVGFVATIDWNNPGGVFGSAFFINGALYQTAFFADSTLQTIRVRVTDVGAINVLDTTWTFTTATSAFNHGPYIINASDDNYQNNNGIMSANDPIRFDLLIDPILGNTLDTTTLGVLFNFGFQHVVTGGVTQPGWQFNTTPILGGFRCEMQTSPASPWGTVANVTISCSGTQPTGSTGAGIVISGVEANIRVAPPNQDPFSPAQIPPFPLTGNVPPDWVGLQPTQGYADLLSGLGVPIWDTLQVVQNVNPPVTIYDSGAGGYQAGWAGALAATGPAGPVPAPAQQGTRNLFGPTGVFANPGDTLAFTGTGHIISPATGVSYPISWTWTWDVTDSLTSTPTPASGSTGQPNTLVWQVLISDPTFSSLITFNALMVTITPLVGPPVTSTVYTGGAFQAGWTGAGSQVLNQGTSNVTVQVDKSTPYNPGDHVSFFALDAQAPADDLIAPSGPFTFDVAGPPPFINVLFVSPVGSNLLRVFLSKEPLHQSVLGPNDALNRLLWTVSSLAGPGDAPVIENVLNPMPQPGLLLTPPVANLSTASDNDTETTQKGYMDIPPGSPWSIDLRVSLPLRLSTNYQVVASPDIQAADGSTLAGPPNDRGATLGSRPEPSTLPQKPATVSAGVDFNYDFFQGRFILTPKGDVDVMSGVAALKKRIIRRLITSPGQFFHLPTYGVNLRVKETAHITDLAQLKVAIETQVAQESEVSSVVASLSLGVDLLTVTLVVKTKSATGFQLVLTLTPGGQLLTVDGSPLNISGGTLVS